MPINKTYRRKKQALDRKDDEFVITRTQSNVTEEIVKIRDVQLKKAVLVKRKNDVNRDLDVQIAELDDVLQGLDSVKNEQAEEVEQPE